MQKSITLIELLLVVGILAVVSAIALLVISPSKQPGLVRDEQRKSDVNTILAAVYQYIIDNDGKYPPGIPTGMSKEICSTGAMSCNNGVVLDVLTKNYLVKIPSDPLATGTGTSYVIMQDSAQHITVSAPRTEQKEVISVTR